jgi:phage/plasmid-associated DNA primase
MAHLVQRPGGPRPGVSIVLRGKQGTGKGCFVSQFGKIMGSHFLHITNQGQLTGKFNSHLKDALLVFIDEGIWAGDKQAEGTLKALITEDLLHIEPKGKEPFTVQNFVRLIVATNNNWAVPAGPEERRFFVLDVNENKIQDHEYFREIFEEMNNGGREAMLHDLLEWDIANFNLYKFPRTRALFDQILASMNSAQKFWFERLRAGTLYHNGEEWEGHIPSQKLYAYYVEFSQNIGERRPLIDSQLLKELRKFCRVGRTQLTVNAKRTPVLMFPELKECRTGFEKTLNMTLAWDEETAEYG